MVKYLTIFVLLISIYVIEFTVVFTNTLQKIQAKRWMGVVTSSPEKRNSYSEFVIDNAVHVRSNDSTISYGDIVEIIITSRTRVISPPKAEFWLYYREITKQESDIGCCWYKDLLITIEKALIFFKAIKDIFRDKVQIFFRQEEVELLMGMVIGDKSALSPDMRKIITTSGLMHLVVASGTNISLVSFFVSQMLKPFLNKKSIFLICLCCILIYLTVAGFEPPLVRASVFWLLISLNILYGRKVSNLWILGITCFLMLFISPLLLFSLSFQLSFLATFSLFTLTNPYYRLIQKMISPDRAFLEFILQSVAQVIAVYSVLSPILILNFEEINILSPLSSLLATPFVPYIVLTALVFFFVSLVSHWLALIFVFILQPMLFMVNSIASFFATVANIPIASSIPVWVFFLQWLFSLKILYIFHTKRNKDA